MTREEKIRVIVNNWIFHGRSVGPKRHIEGCNFDDLIKSLDKGLGCSTTQDHDQQDVSTGQRGDGELREALEAYLTALDAEPEKDCWDTETGEEEPGAHKFASDWAWSDWHEAKDAALMNLRAVFAAAPTPTEATPSEGDGIVAWLEKRIEVAEQDSAAHPKDCSLNAFYGGQAIAYENALSAVLSRQNEPARPVGEDALREALEFYATAWEYDCDAQLIGPGVWDGGSISCDPSDELRADKGEMARKALASPTQQAPDQGEVERSPIGGLPLANFENEAREVQNAIVDDNGPSFHELTEDHRGWVCAIVRETLARQHQIHTNVPATPKANTGEA